MVRMTNCPICNEPVVKMKMRTDHATQQMGIPAICKGQQGQAEIAAIVMERHAHEDAQRRWDPATGRIDFAKP